MRRSYVAFFIMPALIAATHTFAGGPSPSPAHRVETHAATACEAARLSAWFERQRELTDGDVDPAKVLPAPRECIRTDVRAEERMPAHRAEAPAREESGG